LRGRFAVDVLALFPFMTIFEPYMEMDLRRISLFIKLLRLQNGFHLINYSVMMRELKQIQFQWI